MKRWCVKARDGWHFAVPNKPWPDGENNIKTACGSVVILPYGCENRDTTCKDCLDAAKAKKEG